MRIIPVEVDNDRKESMSFKDASFPVDTWDDMYDTFIDETLNCHWHHEFEFGVLISGTLDFYVGGIHMKMNKGDCIFINSNIMHTAKQAEGVNNTVIKGVAFPAALLSGDISGTVYKKYFEPVMTSTIQGLVISHDNEAANTITESVLTASALINTTSGYELSCISILSSLWESMYSYIKSDKPELLSSKGSRIHEQRAKRLLSYIHENYRESITIDCLARHANVSRSECFRSFRQFTNKNPIEYLNEYRLMAAANLLMETGLSVTEIGMTCGFSNSCYFGELFKRAYGVSPGRYRRKDCLHEEEEILEEINSDDQDDAMPYYLL